jgi:predicted O-methyltransferase YrrM
MTGAASMDWAAVDGFIADHLLGTDPALEAALAANAAAGLPPIDVSPAHGRFLHLMTRIAGARRVLEIGTLGGYSTICFARAVGEGGQVVTLEIDPHHAEVARTNIAGAGMTGRVDLRLGAALDLLEAMTAAGEPAFDLVFMDADKRNNPNYLKLALDLSRAGTVIICDNVVRKGAVMDADSEDEDIQGTRLLFDVAGNEKRLSATAIQTVGLKGWDGFLLALVKDAA